MRPAIIVSLGALLLFGVLVIAQQQDKKSGLECTPSSSPSNAASSEEATQFKCLPDDVALIDVVTYGPTPEKNVTVRDKLIKLKAKCENGKLVDDHHREIRFFRVECSGIAPADHAERQQRQQEELKKLEKKYTVIVMGCNLRIE